MIERQIGLRALQILVVSLVAGIVAFAVFGLFARAAGGPPVIPLPWSWLGCRWF